MAGLAHMVVSALICFVLSESIFGMFFETDIAPLITLLHNDGALGVVLGSLLLHHVKIYLNARRKKSRTLKLEKNIKVM